MNTTVYRAYTVGHGSVLSPLCILLLTERFSPTFRVRKLKVRKWVTHGHISCMW